MSDAYPNQSIMQSVLTAMGACGSNRPVKAVDIAPIARLPKGVKLVQIVSLSNAGGWYGYVSVTGPLQNIGLAVAKGAFDVTLPNDNSGKPDGLISAAADTQSLGINLPENGCFTHVLPVGSYQLVLPVSSFTPAPGKPPIEIGVFDVDKPVTLQITGTSVPVQGTNEFLGRATYSAICLTGAASTNTSKDATVDLQIPDPGEKLPGPVPTSATDRTVYFENDFEVNTQAPAGMHAHALVTDGTIFVEGRLVAFANDTRPIYRGYAPPLPVLSCTCEDDSTGANGTKTANATYKYNCRDEQTGNLLATSQTPEWDRPDGPLHGAATKGLYIYKAGVFTLLTTDEEEAGKACP